ncbi:hypothetical protein C475_18731 [Halosimplex carlsbadense 2-9-1]|uniref:Uncharacterized protein n=1 Tax=Halosimplex carlsbadense 2-9-1 TaxID=797114 RepID=M0CGJ5_9EURY|nr:hypothetical protein C475_18731 [Halosimplex carlsbadense 2-9-1]
MRTTESRVTARIVRTENGEMHTEYEVGGVGYSSREAVETLLEGR